MAATQTDTTPDAGRPFWVEAAQRVAGPVLRAAAAGTLRADLPLEQAEGQDKRNCAPLEALGRTLAGLAPWLEADADAGATEAAGLAREAIAHAVGDDPAGRLPFDTEGQSLVDASFLALGLLRAPTALLDPLDAGTRERLRAALIASRRNPPHFNNWLLFSATIEATLARLGEPDWDRARVDYALRQHEQWHLQGGVYGDGPKHAADYYNSFVIHPMLTAVLAEVGDEHNAWVEMREAQLERHARHAGVLAASIHPDGTFPPLGRSITYRFGALQALGDAALRGNLPDGLAPAAVRRAMTASLARFTGSPAIFDADGWLRIGLGGHQPALGERYITTGSLYLFCCGFLPLGLPPEHRFWADPPAATPWEQRWVMG